MKKAKQVFFLLFLALFFTGATCSKVPPAKPNTAEQNKVDDKKKDAENTLDKMDRNKDLNNIQVSSLAQGVNYTLNQVTNPTAPVKTAISLNDRIIAIVGAPNLDESKRIKSIVDLLNSSIEEEKKKGASLLEDKDKEITKLQKEKDKLTLEYDEQMWELAEQAREAAEKADAKQQTIDAMGGMFGLNAVIWGLKKFFFSTLTFIIVFCIIFIILRLLSTINPIAGAAFSIFNMLGSLVISSFKALTPKAFELCNMVPSIHKDEYKEPLFKIVDVIQEFRVKSEENPDKVFTVQNILDKLDRDMDKPEKDFIKEILKELRWKK